MELLHIVKQIDSQYIINPAIEQDLLFKLLPLLSPIIVIFTFFFNNWYNVVTKRKESKRNWYFKAYFEPNLKRVEDFFRLADSEMKNALDLYIAGDGEALENKVEFIAIKLSELADIKRKFSIEVLQILKPAYPEEFSNLEDILNNFEDACSNAFTTPPSPEAYFIYLTTINKIKGDMIKTLSGPALK